MAAHPALTFTTFTVSVSIVPALPSRMSLLKMSVSEGYGPAVSLGVTAHAALVEPVVVVPEDDVSVGLVGELLPHPIARAAPAAAPSPPSSSRRPIFFMLMFCSFVVPD